MLLNLKWKENNSENSENVKTTSQLKVGTERTDETSYEIKYTVTLGIERTPHDSYSDTA
jgi:hypothetical protein